MVSIAACVVSSWMGFIGVPLTYVVMPRLRSACGPVMVAPRSVYAAPTWMIAGLLPPVPMPADLI
jgi:hypothetical protein